MSDLSLLRPAWVEVDLDAAAHNFRALKKKVDPKTKFMAVVKGDAYGCSSALPAQLMVELGADYLAVAILDEALELRRAGITAPILVLGYTPTAQAGLLVEHDITQTVFNMDAIEAISEAAVRKGKNAKIHIKLDTGMNRVGLPADEGVVEFIKAAKSLTGIIVEGIFTHFAVAEMEEPGDREYTIQQCGAFRNVIFMLEDAGIHIPLKHAANSAGILHMPESHYDMVRAGTAIFGLTVTDEYNRELGIKPVISLKVKIAHVKEIPPSQTISYGRTFITKRTSTIVTLPIGYADGYSRLFSNKSQVLVGGKRVPQVGRVCMDQCMVDVTDLETKPQVGDTAVLIGRQGTESITAKELSALMGPDAFDLEVITHLTKRLPRVYIWHGRPIAIYDMAGLDHLDSH